jgi:replication initiation and membrane attachment protein DnaB
MELGYYYAPPVPQPPPPPTPNRNPLLEKLLESLIGSVKFFANAENFAVASTELMAKVNGVFELARQMKLSRVKESDHEHVWTQVTLFLFSSFLFLLLI